MILVASRLQNPELSLALRFDDFQVADSFSWTTDYKLIAEGIIQLLIIDRSLLDLLLRYMGQPFRETSHVKSLEGVGGS